MIKYSFSKGVFKALTSLLLFAIPFLITNYPEVANLTIGSALVLVTNFLKVKYIK